MTNPDPKLRPFERARQYLMTVVGSSEPGTRLPPVNILAGQAGVSTVTMWKAVGHLKAQGILEGAQRRGTRVLGINEPLQSGDVSPGADGPLWKRLVTQIEADCLAGAFGRGGALPSVKQLQARYNASFRTLKKSLGALVESHVIAPSGRGYRLAESVSGKGGGKVLVFIYMEREELALRYLDISLLRTIEVSFRQAGLIPCFVRYFRTGESVVYTDHATGKPWRPESGVLGCFWLVLFEHEIIDDCCSRMLSLSCPIAVFDNTENGRFPSFFQKNPSVKFLITTPSERGGEVMASRMLALGHRNVAFLTTHGAKVWAQRVWDGFRRVYDTAGARVDLLSCENPFDENSEASQFDLARMVIDHAVDNVPRLPNAVPSHLREHLNRTVATGLNHSYYMWGIACTMEPLFKQALKITDATAWVCSIDDEAILALAFLKRSGVAVPQKLSVAGILNSLHSLRYNLTSYGDNYEAVIHAAVDFIVRPNVLGSARNRKVISVDGMLVERGTTAPVRS